jgi:ABC-2 type transport system ATP-binding protein
MYTEPEKPANRVGGLGMPVMARQLAVDTKHLGRVYHTRGKKSDSKTLVALDDITLEVPCGELFGVLGPNGAGKTTLIKILTTLLAPTSGSARVAGYDVSREKEKVRPLINMVSGGESSGYGLLTVRENLWMFAQFYGISSMEANRRIRELLDVVKMGDRINTKSSQLSTGLRQKMNIVRGFLTDPQVLFLDEPTLGLDVEASRDVRAFIRRWMDQDPKRTLLLTTHYMAEADELCDRVAIINHGRVLACDKPSTLKQCLHREAIFRLETTSLDGFGTSALEAIPGVRSVTHHAADGHAKVELILEEEKVIAAVIAAMESHQIGLLRLAKHEPTLEDVFVKLVGRSMEEVELVHDPATA